jgi:protein KRI1
VSTRFRYVPVQPQNYALTPVEILLATDQELNNYVSVKKYAPYRQDKGDRHRWNKKDQEKLHELKSIIKNRSGNTFGTSSMGGGQASGDGGEKSKKRKGKKERMKAKVAVGQPEEVSEVPANDQTISVVDEETTSFKKRKRDDNDNVQPVEPKLRKKKKRKHQENDDAAAQAH